MLRTVPPRLGSKIHYFESLPFASLFPKLAAVIHHGGTSVLVSITRSKPSAFQAESFQHPFFFWDASVTQGIGGTVCKWKPGMNASA
jgi:hypothetical protein